MLKKQLCILICLIQVVSLTGCYDANEVDNMTHVLTLGVDKGVTDKWRLTLQFPTLKGDSQKQGDTGGGQGEQKGGEGGYSIVTVDAPSFYTGIDMLNTSLQRRINFMHADLLVISEDLAKSELLGEYIVPIVRFRQIRRSMNVVVCKGPAMEFVKANKPIIGSTLTKNVELLFKEADITGFFPKVTLTDFYEGMKSTYDQPIAALGAVNNFSSFSESGEGKQDKDVSGGEYYAGQLPRTGESKLELFGTAVFDGERMVGELDGDETRLMMIGRGKFKTAFYTVKDPEVPDLVIPIDLRQTKKPDIKIELSENKPTVNMKVYLEGDIMAVQSRVNYEDPDLQPKLEKAIEQDIKNGLDKLASKSKSFKVDILNFAHTAIKQFKTIQEWEDYNWMKQYENIVINTEVKFTARRSGTQLKSSPITSTEGKE